MPTKADEPYKYRVLLSRQPTGNFKEKTLWLYAKSIEEASKGVVDWVIEQGSSKYTFGLHRGILQDIATGEWIGRVFRNGLVVSDVKWMPTYVEPKPPSSILVYEPKVKRKLPDNAGLARQKAIRRRAAESRSKTPSKPKKQHGLLVWE